MKSLTKLKELRKEKETLEKCEVQVNEKKDFKYMVKEKRMRKIEFELGVYKLFCHVCSCSCQFPCKAARTEEKFRCHSMKKGSCMICLNKCSVSQHILKPYRFGLQEVEVEKTKEDVKKRYEAGMKGKATAEKIMEQFIREFLETEVRVHSNFFSARACLQKLEEIALKPDPFLIIECIDLLLESENGNNEPGYLERVEMLKKEREHAELLRNICDGFDHFRELRDHHLLPNKGGSRLFE
ncbi:unnamed protein product [Darwinula stevensoni]|uniref:Uncharacterized protein n=1 Tax=Darwinula stevensoni TaxID=69355 RepID=A0A7R8WY54_9CRUS|nr:unnamed protein product [Darwinula stevensoni]CAG0878967.1 unnamed protein product [Darwinula stevensoni]